MKVTAYHFYHISNGYELVKDEKLYQFSDAMMACMVTQYRLMGYIIETTETWISAIKIEKVVDKPINL